MLGFGKKKDVFDQAFGKDADHWRDFANAPTEKSAESEEERPYRVQIGSFTGGMDSQVQYRWDDGSKFPGGFGPTQLLTADYWTLRARSAELFEKNLYARGLIRRLITNEINTGLHLEATPMEALLGYPEDGLSDWSENIENRFEIWGNDPELCDHVERSRFGVLQATARMESLVEGDILVVPRQDQRTGLPRVQLISGSCIQTPLGAKPQQGNKICHGVEIDGQGRHVAYWVQQESKDGWTPVSKRLPAYGEKSGRRLAWMLYGTEKRLDDVRGKPILSLILQSLKEIDRYRDSVQRKAVVNSILAMFIKRDEDKSPTKSLTGGATRKGTDVAVGGDNGARRFRIAENHPGMVLEQLQVGEEPVGFNSNGTDEKFGDFEMALLQSIAWANEVPPETLVLSFNSNYSASQAATQEFRMYLNKVRDIFGGGFCQPLYIEWLISELLLGRIEARGLLDAWSDRKKYDVFGAWTFSDWSGQIKPAIDEMKTVRAKTEAIAAGLTTRDRAARELNGTKYSRNVKKLLRENVSLAAANAPLAPPAPDAPVEPDADEELAPPKKKAS